MKQVLLGVFTLVYLVCFSQDTLPWQDQVVQIQLRAKSLSNQGDFDSAVFVTHQAINLSLFSGGDTSIQYIESLLYQGNNFYYQRTLDSALYYYRLSGEAGKTSLSEDSRHFGKVWNNMANILSSQEQYDDALEYYLKAAKNKEKSMPPHSLSLAKTYMNIGDMYMRKTYMDRAYRYFEMTDSIVQKRDVIKANEGGRSGSSSLLKAVLFNSLNEYYNRLNDFETSHEYTFKSYTLLKEMLGVQHPYVVQATANVGISYKELGNRDRAVLYLEKAKNIREELYGNIPNTQLVSSYTNLGACHLSFQEEGLAKKYFQKAFELGQEVFGDKGDLMTSICNSLGKIYQEEGDVWSALEFYSKAISIAENTYGKQHLKIAEGYQRLGKVHEQIDLNKVALEFYQYGLYSIDLNVDTLDFSANPSSTGLLAPSIQTVYLLTSKARVLAQQEDWKSTLNATLLADTLSCRIRQSYLSEASKIRLRELDQDNIGLALQSLFHLWKETENKGYVQQAFALLSNGKSSLLNEHWQEMNGRKIAGIPQYLLETERGLKKDISFYKQLVYSAEKEDENVEVWKSNLAERKKELKNLHKQLSEDYPNYIEYTQQNHFFSIDGYQKKMKKEACLLEYFVLDSSVFVLTLTANDVQFVSLPADNLSDKINKFRSAISTSNFSEYTRSAHELYKDLIEPLELHQTTLTIIPSGELFTLPFDALLSKSVDTNNVDYRLPYLLNDYVIHYYPSTYLLEHQKESNYYYGLEPYLGIAPNYNESGHENLPKSVEEVTEIAIQFSGVTLVDSHATEQLFKEKAKNFEILHIAAHATLNDENPMYSDIVFTQDSAEDGHLFTYELYNMQLNADLAVLSACNTGSGKIHEGEGVAGLARGFQFAGVKNLMITLWKVPDFSSAKIITQVFEELFEKKGKAEALTSAKRKYVAQADALTANPLYWSGFVLIGDDMPINSSSKAHYFLIGLLVLALLLFFMINRKNLV